MQVNEQKSANQQLKDESKQLIQTLQMAREVGRIGNQSMIIKRLSVVFHGLATNIVLRCLQGAEESRIMCYSTKQ